MKSDQEYDEHNIPQPPSPSVAEADRFLRDLIEHATHALIELNGHVERPNQREEPENFFTKERIVALLIIFILFGSLFQLCWMVRMDGIGSSAPIYTRTYQ